MITIIIFLIIQKKSPLTEALKMRFSAGVSPAEGPKALRVLTGKNGMTSL
ncbi:MAG: hypothetical protein PHF19_05240 [Synergistales bacterium]|nr:hypothetical protein [Synergistales bacterium]